MALIHLASLIWKTLRICKESPEFSMPEEISNLFLSFVSTEKTWKT